MRPSGRILAWGAAVILGAAAVFMLLVVLAVWRYTLPGRKALALATPPSSVTNLVGFYRWRPELDSAFRAHSGAEEFVVVLGPPGRSEGQALGAAGYLFDPVGTLVEWSPDLGDDPLDRIPASNHWIRLAPRDLRALALGTQGP